MKKGTRLLLIIFSIAFLPISAMAVGGPLIEVRAGVGLTSADADSFGDDLQSSGLGSASTDDFDSYNLDVFFNIPVLPIGAGLRYEQGSQDADITLSGNKLKSELDIQNISLLVDWRIIDTGFYIGPIVSIGIPNADYKLSGATPIDESLDGNLSYSLAAEAGVRISRLVVGAEAGYQSIKLDAPSSSLFGSDVELDGFYGKLMVGLTFLKFS